jgi:7 transmembrane helices usually fused to an inactive transglutaminase/Transglutaminase-like superfamily
MHNRRTLLCVGTAALLIAVSVALMITRNQVLGDDVRLPGGPETWKITLVISGKATSGDARLYSAAPLESPRQHVLHETRQSEQFDAKPSDAKASDQRETAWVWKPGRPPGTFRLHYECFCTVRRQPQPGEHGHPHHGPPKPGQYLRSDAAIDSDHPEIAALARRQTEGEADPVEQARALFEFVDQQIASEPGVDGSGRTAIECLQAEAGDALAKSRLLAALLRNRGIPSRLVVGLALAKGTEQSAHVWVEAWLRDHWLPMCPLHHHFGHLPHTFLVFGYDDFRVVHGRNIRGLDSAFWVERAPRAAGAADPSWLHRAFSAFSPFALPPAEKRLVEFLLLLPVAALIVCFFRNVIGLTTFGTFAPALLGLAFREVHSLIGITVFVGILLSGWLLRRGLSRFHLLQVPRTAFMLTLVVCLLVGFVVVSSRFHLPATRYLALFPLVILTGMIERFWTLEEEDGTAASFRTLFATFAVAACVSLVLNAPMVPRLMNTYPETLGVIMAVQLLLGRYTGYRLTELYRFRDFLKEPAAAPVLSFRQPSTARF